MDRFLPTIAGVFVIGIAFLVFFFWYWGSPKFTDVGYRPAQPVKYSHKLHAGDLGMDCRYCHSQIEQSRHANIPSTQTCMNCHKQVGLDNPNLRPVRESWDTGKPIEWVRVHKLPDYAYFNHAAHLRAGVGCIECHGNVRQMDVVEQVKPLSMSWCLDCHRNPDSRLRPLSELTNMEWTPPPDHAEFVKRFKAERNINPPEDCSACHR
jgi:hypothetical protein